MSRTIYDYDYLLRTETTYMEEKINQIKTRLQMEPLWQSNYNNKKNIGFNACVMMTKTICNLIVWFSR